MSISPDTDAIYTEALELQARIEELEARQYEYRKYLRDEELVLLANGFMKDADPKTRLAAVKLRADQITEEKHPELVAQIADEHAAINGIRFRNEGIVAAGWAEQFALNSWTRELRDPKKKGELGA